ncbi:Arrestin-related trafficking adapter 5 [Spathaspora sp. JA1]|nr:Arrestin-related trafficking adapter 5 [Spathaspora sp. JA1]
MFGLGLNLALFDIKLKTPYKGLLFLRGNEYEVESVPFFGEVKLSLNEDAHVKRIHLYLVGEFQYDYITRGENFGFYAERFVDKVCVLRVDWNNLLTSEDGEVLFGNYGDTTAPMDRFSPRSRRNSVIETSFSLDAMPGLSPTKSLPAQMSDSHSRVLEIPESGFDGTPFKNQKSFANQTFLLPKGNYSLPFKIYLPTDICETVEGLKEASLRYRIHCNIERGRFEKTESKSKYLRIIRTLHPQNLNLSESIEIHKTWPDKIQYKVSMVKKAIAIGSIIPINVIIVPIVKGLSLQGMNCSITEHFHIQQSHAQSPEYEKTIGKQPLIIPTMEELDYERWVIKTQYTVPHNLKELTQTCEIKNNMISVRHRLRISIKFKNPGGHISELRVNLPVTIYISANSGFVVDKCYEVSHNGTVIPNNKLEEVLFSRSIGQVESRSGPSQRILSPVPDRIENNVSSDEGIDLDREETAPPLYQQHVFDKVYDMNSTRSPLQQFQTQVQDASPMASPNNSVLNLSAYVERPESIDSSIDSDEEDPISPMRTLNVEVLSKVPTYDEAFDQDVEHIEEQGFAPLYPATSDFADYSDRSDDSISFKSPSRSRSRSRRNSFGYRNLSLPRFSHSQERECGEEPKRRNSLGLGRLFRMGRRSIS